MDGHQQRSSREADASRSRPRPASDVDRSDDQASAGGDRPENVVERRAPSESESATTAPPASANRMLSSAADVCGWTLSGLDAQDVQCCGVFRWQRRSWCSNGAVARKTAYSAT